MSTSAPVIPSRASWLLSRLQYPHQGVVYIVNCSVPLFVISLTSFLSAIVGLAGRPFQHRADRTASLDRVTQRGTPHKGNWFGCVLVLFLHVVIDAGRRKSEERRV